MIFEIFVNIIPRLFVEKYWHNNNKNILIYCHAQRPNKKKVDSKTRPDTALLHGNKIVESL